jgi:hypothetical protein
MNRPPSTRTTRGDEDRAAGVVEPPACGGLGGREVADVLDDADLDRTEVVDPTEALVVEIDHDGVLLELGRPGRGGHLRPALGP